jgi:hypothetical protein
VLEEGVVDRAAGLDQADQNRHRNPVAFGVHVRYEAANFRRQLRVGAFQVAEDLLADEIDAIEIVGLGRYRCEAIAFQHQAENRNSPGSPARHSIKPSFV